MTTRGDPEDLQQASIEAHALCDNLADVLDGRDMSVGIAALFAMQRLVGQQVEPAVRVLVVRDLRELADELEALDAARH